MAQSGDDRRWRRAAVPEIHSRDRRLLRCRQLRNVGAAPTAPFPSLPFICRPHRIFRRFMLLGFDHSAILFIKPVAGSTISRPREGTWSDRSGERFSLRRHGRNSKASGNPYDATPAWMTGVDRSRRHKILCRSLPVGRNHAPIDPTRFGLFRCDEESSKQNRAVSHPAYRQSRRRSPPVNPAPPRRRWGFGRCGLFLRPNPTPCTSPCR